MGINYGYHWTFSNKNNGRRWNPIFDNIFTCISTFCALSKAVCLRLHKMSAFAPYLEYYIEIKILYESYLMPSHLYILYQGYKIVYHLRRRAATSLWSFSTAIMSGVSPRFVWTSVFAPFWSRIRHSSTLPPGIDGPLGTLEHGRPENVYRSVSVRESLTSSSSSHVKRRHICFWNGINIHPEIKFWNKNHRCPESGPLTRPWF